MKKTLQVLITLSLLLSILLLPGCSSDADNPHHEQNGSDTHHEYPSPDEQDPAEENSADQSPYPPAQEPPLASNNNGEDYPPESTPNGTTGEHPPPQEPPTADIHHDYPLEIKAVYDANANFTTTWAKTPTHFFIAHVYFTVSYNIDGINIGQRNYALYRVPLNNLEQGTRVPIPGDGEIGIVGVNDYYLFISRWDGDFHQGYYEIYRISLQNLHVQLIDSGMFFGVPRLHQASNSILVAYEEFNGLDGSIYRLESLSLDTGKRRTVYEFEDHHALGIGWRQIEGDAVLFLAHSWGSGIKYVLIDSELVAMQIQSSQIYAATTRTWPPQLNNPAEEFIYTLEWGPFTWGMRHATMGNWLYYLWSDDWLPWGGFGNSLRLYRIRLDGTQNMLLQDEMGFNSLLYVGNTLFATVYTPSHHDVDWHEAVILSQYGDIERVIGGGGHGHNCAFDIRRFQDTDMVKIMEFNFFRIDGRVQGLFCTATGALFSLYTPRHYEVHKMPSCTCETFCTLCVGAIILRPPDASYNMPIIPDEPAGD